ncbi:hypothetical protein CXF70_00955 [Planomicrobium sp. MB-3u-38]|nr:hypothetical protein CXF70_00955 [Planomicrobium sp. MB-3u-38]
MANFLYIFVIALFAVCFFFFLMNFVGEYSQCTLIFSVFGMLNASIAIGVAEVLNKTRDLTAD